jgi:hypothetical protein
MWMRPFPGEVESIFFAVLPLGWVASGTKAQNRNGWFRSRTSGLSKRRMEHGLKWDQVTFTGARISIPGLSTTIAVTVQAKSVTNLAFIS